MLALVKDGLGMIQILDSNQLWPPLIWAQYNRAFILYKGQDYSRNNV